MIFLAILVTGDVGDNVRSVEALLSNGSSLCSLPDLPAIHWDHTQSGLVTCGGIFTSRRKCEDVVLIQMMDGCTIGISCALIG